ncbi:hypothetical protein HY491_03540 [Candidatus Woesearchaeota archaeon]|nr:hypothetical protein [Candidatus Woesearchaeota archaeon]
MINKKVVIGVMAGALLALVMLSNAYAENVYCGYYAPLRDRGLAGGSYESWYCADTKINEEFCCPAIGLHRDPVTNAQEDYYGGAGEPTDRQDCIARFTSTLRSSDIASCKPENRVWCLNKANQQCIHIAGQQCQGPIKQEYGKGDSDACYAALADLRRTGFVPPQILPGATTGDRVLGFRVVRTTQPNVPQLTLEWTPYQCSEFTIQKRECTESTGSNCEIPPGEEKHIFLSDIAQQSGAMRWTDTNVRFGSYYSYHIKPECGDKVYSATVTETPGDSDCAGGQSVAACKDEKTISRCTNYKSTPIICGADQRCFIDPDAPALGPRCTTTTAFPSLSQCNPLPLGLVNQDACTQTRGCYADASATVLDSCKSCKDTVTACSNYYGKSACESNRCGVGPCQWNPIGAELGIGYCSKVGESKCTYCKTAEAAPPPAETNKVFGMCAQAEFAALQCTGTSVDTAAPLTTAIVSVDGRTIDNKDIVDSLFTKNIMITFQVNEEADTFFCLDTSNACIPDIPIVDKKLSITPSGELMKEKGGAYTTTIIRREQERYSIRYFSKDTTGHEESPKSITFSTRKVVDSAAPILKSFYPTRSNSIVQQLLITIADDTGVDASSIDVLVGGSSVKGREGFRISTVNETDVDVTYQPALSQQYLLGENRIRITGRDKTGKALSADKVLTIDPSLASAPTATLVDFDAIYHGVSEGNAEKKRLAPDARIATRITIPEIRLNFGSELVKTERITLTGSRNVDLLGIQPPQDNTGSMFIYRQLIQNELGNGEYLLEIIARKQLDKGLLSNPAAFRYRFTVDGMPPEIDVFVPAQPVRAGALQIYAESDEPLQKAMNISVYYVSEARNHMYLLKDAAMSCLGAGKQECRYTYTIAPEHRNGQLFVEAEGEDLVGNSGSGIVPFFVDTLGPRITSVRADGRDYACGLLNADVKPIWGCTISEPVQRLKPVFQARVNDEVNLSAVSQLVIAGEDVARIAAGTFAPEHSRTKILELRQLSAAELQIAVNATLVPGSNTYLLRLVDNYGNGEFNVIAFTVDIPLLRFEILSPPYNTSTTENYTLRVKTIDPANWAACRYSFTPLISFENMNAQLATTDNVIHTVALSGSRNIFIACNNSYGYTGNKLAIELRHDPGQPGITGIQARPEVIAEENEAGYFQTKLFVTTDKDTRCSYSRNDTKAVYPFSDGFASSHEMAVPRESEPRLADSLAYLFNVSCMGKNGIMSASRDVLVRVDTTAPLTVAITKPDGPYASPDVTIEAVTSKRRFTSCTISEGSQQLPVVKEGNRFTAAGNFPHGQHTITVSCTRIQEQAQASKTFTVDATPPSRPVVRDSGDSAAGFAVRTITAEWESVDSESGISQHQYRVINQNGSAVVEWRATREQRVEIDVDSNNLLNNSRYRVMVRSQNNVGLWSENGTSAGIMVDKRKAVSRQQPGNATVVPQRPAACTTGAACTISGCPGTYTSACDCVDVPGDFCPSLCLVDSDKDGYGLGCPRGLDCNDQVKTATVQCSNGCVQDGDGDGYGLGCAIGPDCDDRDAAVRTGCVSGCTQDSDGDGYGLGCDKGFDCDDTDDFLGSQCTNRCVQDGDGDEFGLGCGAGGDCDDADPAFHSGCTSMCSEDKDGDGYGLGCAKGDDCDDTAYSLQNACTTGCAADNDGDGYGLACSLGDDCNENDPLVHSSCDLDKDGMPDDWERNFGLDTSRNDAREDPDDDGLVNIDEYRLGTDPTKPDTDGDGYTDLEERDAGTDPKDPDSHPRSTVWIVVLVIIAIAGGLTAAGYVGYKEYLKMQKKPVSRAAAPPRAVLPARKPMPVQRRQVPERSRIFDMFAQRGPAKAQEKPKQEEKEGEDIFSRLEEKIKESDIFKKLPKGEGDVFAELEKRTKKK